MTIEELEHRVDAEAPDGFGEAVLDALTLLLRAAKPGTHIRISVHDIAPDDFRALPGTRRFRSNRAAPWSKTVLDFYTIVDDQPLGMRVADAVSVAYFQALPKRGSRAAAAFEAVA